tara:strand:+ start:1354 stop:1914 length:561 start_codon:yes stop_codon:yes gene_type:complete
MNIKLSLSKILISILALFLLTNCGGGLKKSDARKVSPDPKERVKKNLEEGRGFRLSNIGKNQGSGNFEFSTSNELWRASLDAIDFIPLSNANYSGGIIITDWYSENQKMGESVKISIRFLTNEIRSDALDIKVFVKKCKTVLDCEIKQNDGQLKAELTKSILKKAAKYQKENKKKNFKPYTGKVFD